MDREYRKVILRSNVQLLMRHNRPPGPPTGETHRYTQVLLDVTGVTSFVVSQAVGDATTTRRAFDMAEFVRQTNLTVVSSNFFNVTGV